MVSIIGARMSYSLASIHSDGPDSGRTQRGLFAWSLLAGVWLLAALAAPFFAGRVYLRDDLGAFHLPVRAFYAEQLARGEPFDWMPQLYSGFYLTGEGQAGTYHPWHWLLYRALPLRAALAWEWLSVYPLMLAGAWLFLRRQFRRRDVAMAGSLLFAFSGFSLLRLVHPNAVAVIAHLPWLLWAIDIVLVDASRRRVAWALAGIALLTGSQVLLGYPQYVWFSLLAEAAYAGFLVSARRHAPRAGCVPSPWPRLLIAKGAGLLLGGVQWLPTLDALLDSTRPSADATFTAWGSLHPMNLVQLVAPYLFDDRVLGGNTHELSVYLGAAPLMLVAWVVVRRRQLGPLAPLVRAAGWLAVASLLLAMGEYGQIYRLQQYLPVVGRFRCPCRYLVLFNLSMATIASVGLWLLVHARGGQEAEEAETAGSLDDLKKDRPQTGALWAIVLFSAAVALAGALLHDRPMSHALAGPILMAVAAGLVTAAARGARGALAALVMLAAADLGYYGLSYSVIGQSDRLEHFAASVSAPPIAGQAVQTEARPGDFTKPDAVRLESLTRSRVFAPPVEVDGAKLWIGNQMLLAGWQRTDGYTGLEPRRQLDYYTLAALRVSATRWVRRDTATSTITGLVPRDDQWLEVPHPLPRARLVSQAVVGDCPARDLQRIDIERAALCEVPLALSPGEPGSAEIAAERPGRIEIKVHCDSPQLLVVAESYHSGWRCAVGDQARPLLRVNGDFLGCLVQPGETAVVLEFHPSSLSRGWLATLAGLGLVACWAACSTGFSRLSPNSPVPRPAEADYERDEEHLK